MHAKQLSVARTLDSGSITSLISTKHVLKMNENKTVVYALHIHRDALLLGIFQT